MNTLYKRYTALLLIVFLALGTRYAYSYITEKGNESPSSYEVAMRADTAGGDTPEATLLLFREALIAEDYEAASSYFMFETDSLSPYYLTTERWLRRLQSVDPSVHQRMIVALTSLRPDLDGKTSVHDYKVYAYAPDGAIETYIDMEQNPYTGVWKIENL